MEPALDLGCVWSVLYIIKLHRCAKSVEVILIGFYIYINMILVFLFNIKRKKKHNSILYQDYCRIVYVWLNLTHSFYIQTASVTGKRDAGDTGRLIMNYRRSTKGCMVYLTNILEITILVAKHNAGKIKVTISNFILFVTRYPICCFQN